MVRILYVILNGFNLEMLFGEWLSLEIGTRYSIDTINIVQQRYTSGFERILTHIKKEFLFKTNRKNSASHGSQDCCESSLVYKGMRQRTYHNYSKKSSYIKVIRASKHNSIPSRQFQIEKHFNKIKIMKLSMIILLCALILVSIPEQSNGLIMKKKLFKKKIIIIGSVARITNHSLLFFQKVTSCCYSHSPFHSLLLLLFFVLNEKNLS